MHPGIGNGGVWNIYGNTKDYLWKTFRHLQILYGRVSLKILALPQQKSHSLVWMLHIHEYNECVVIIQEASTCGIHICAKYYLTANMTVFLNLIAGFL